MLHNQVETGQGALIWNICQLLHLELGKDLQHTMAVRKPTPALLPHLRMSRPGTQAKDRKRPFNGPERQENRWLWAIRVLERQAAPGSKCLEKLILGDFRPCPTNGVLAEKCRYKQGGQVTNLLLEERNPLGPGLVVSSA